LPGTVLADRYEVIDTLGVGGMGAVYKVFDRRLTRVVALKTIHPELAATPLMMKRFKQEVLLAQKITHKNVVRIFDIGEDQGTTFITMDFIEGVSLKDVIRERGAFPPTEAVAMIREVCKALEAAHSEGVIHRDLKPQNIMIDKEQKVVVMDFGIARSAESSGATQTGSLLGTPDYMSPEQARMEEVDARSDIFALGLIFFELLTGKLPFAGKTVVETLFLRTKERAIPPAEIQKNIPKGANDIVVKCLEPDREKRYPSVTEILNDLETFDPTKKVGAAVRVKSRLKKYRTLVVAAALVVVLAVGGFVVRNRFTLTPPAVHDNITVFIADFANHTGNANFDNALEPIVKLALEQATFISAYDRRQAVLVGASKEVLAGRLDETAALKLAAEQGLGFVVSGSLDQKDSKYVLSVKTTESVKQKTIHTDEETAPNEKEILNAATKLASRVRVALGDKTSDSDKRFAMETLSGTSLAAIREYAAAMEAIPDGKYEVARDHFSAATNLDQNFGIAYAGLAVASRNLGNTADAQKFIQQALDKIDFMTDREQMRTRGYYFSLTGDRANCVKEYGRLIEKYPADAAANNNLANCLTQVRDMKGAIEKVGRSAATLPHGVLYRNNLALYESYSSDFPAGEKDALEVRKMKPTYATGFVSLAFAQVGQDRPSEARETYESLEKVEPEEEDPKRKEEERQKNISVARAGQADVALYEGRYKDAVQILERAAADDLSGGQKDRAAMKFAALAHSRLMQGQKPQAVAAAEKALSNSQSVKVRFLAGLVFAETGTVVRAQDMLKSLASGLQPEPKAYAKILEGKLNLRSGNSSAAIDGFSAANMLLDTWIGRFELGKAYLEAKQFVQADSEFAECLKRRGEAMSLFLDEYPTYGHFPQLYYYLGVQREGANNPASTEFFKKYVEIREKAGQDPLVAEAKKRIK
jgi:tetratricopeptide (TPR) repeat protein/predicted Ser/Thr protein kinase